MALIGYLSNNLSQDSEDGMKTKSHIFSRKTERYCYERFLRAGGNERFRLLWREMYRKCAVLREEMWQAKYGHIPNYL